MIFEPYYLACLAHASYLIADEQTKEAAIVDPRRDVDEYLASAKKHGVSIRHVILTHFHADFVAGHLELRERCGAKIYLGARAQAEYDFVPLEEGSRIELGPSVRLEVLETPGHTPEGISVLVFDRKANEKKPHAVLTGDTLFLGDVGRPDLLASAEPTAQDLAGMLYDSLREKLLALPDETLVYPAHGAGSLCGKNLSDERVSTIGVQRKLNYALRPMSKDEFVKLVTSDLAAPPAYFAHDAALNKKERPTLERSLERSLKPLPLEQVLEMERDCAQVVDVRAPADFEACHLVGTINIGLTGKYAPWAGAVLSATAPIVLVAAPGGETEGALRLGRIGFDHVIGYLEGGPAAFEARPDLVRRRVRLDAEGLAARLRGAKPPLVLDVRAPSEWRAARIEGSLNVPLDRLREKIAVVPRDREIVCQCKSGYRSAIAASILARSGIESANLVGGIDAWAARGLPTQSDAALRA